MPNKDYHDKNKIEAYLNMNFARKQLVTGMSLQAKDLRASKDLILIEKTGKHGDTNSKLDQSYLNQQLLTQN